MNLKKIAVAIAFGLASLSATASDLAEVTGNVEIKLGGLTTETQLTAGTNESTWGVGYLESIRSFDNLSKWTTGTTDGYLYYMIYGIADLSVIPRAGGSGFDIYNIGATGVGADGLIHLDIYYSATQIASIDQFKNANPANRTGFDSYSAFAALGDPYLKLVFAEDIQQVDRAETPGIDERISTLVQEVNDQTLPTSGKGSYFLDVVGGTAAGQWDTDSQDFGHDWSGNFTLRPNFGNGQPNCTEAQARSGICFAGLINDPILASKVPEPGSLALLGLGLVGLAALRRRRA